MMLRESFKTSLVMLPLWVFATGLVYPIVITGMAQTLFPLKANGSLIKNEAQSIIGSHLIGQNFTAPRYFWGRPSATQPEPYNAMASSGSNLGPSTPLLAETIQQRIELLRAMDPDHARVIPIDLVTASASGLDPEISIAAAHYQIARVAAQRHLKPEKVAALVLCHQRERQPWLWQEPRVNVLELNLALDQL